MRSQVAFTSSTLCLRILATATTSTHPAPAVKLSGGAAAVADAILVP